MQRAQVDKLLGKLSSPLFGNLSVGGYGDFERSAGYMALPYDRIALAESFLMRGARVLDTLTDSLAELSGEIVSDILAGEVGGITAVKELSWVLGFGGHLFANLHISSCGGDFVNSSPSISLVKNVDTRRLELKRLKIGGSFEQVEALDMSKVVTDSIGPGETFYVDGFEELLWYEESGVLLLNITTLPLGAYEAVYSKSTGARIGVFSSDLRHSSTVVALRCFAASGWGGARELAIRSASHSLREIRWAALNYFWRTDGSELHDDLARFVEDEDREIRSLAQNCINAVASREVNYAI